MSQMEYKKKFPKKKGKSRKNKNNILFGNLYVQFFMSQMG